MKRNKMVEIRIHPEDFKKFRAWADKNQIAHSREENPHYWIVEFNLEDSIKWSSELYDIPLDKFKQSVKILATNSEKKTKIEEKEDCTMESFIKSL